LTPYNRRACSVSKLIGVVATHEDATAEMEQPKSTAGTTPDLAMARGLDGANYNRAPGGGRKMFLTSPFIDQAISLIEGF
jgi:hypothetical protein